MTDTIALTGLVATIPRHLTTGEGLAITSFRLASTQRRYDRGERKWIDGDTNWYTITCFRQLALNALASIEKGQRVVVTGRLRVRDWQTGDRAGTTVEIDADALGHDLSWGSSVFTRSLATSGAQAAARLHDEAVRQDGNGTAEGTSGDSDWSSAGAESTDDAGASGDELAEGHPQALEAALPF